MGKAVDGSALQYNIVRVNGQKSVYVPILKQGGDTNTIAVVNGIEKAITTLRDIPAQLQNHVVFDQSVFVKQAISTVLREGGIGLFLTAVMILIFLGSFRATAAVFLSIPLSVMITFFILHSPSKTINSMVLSGLALAFSRLIDDSVVVHRKYLPPHRAGRRPESGRRERRERSGAGGARYHAGRRRGFLSGDVALRRQQVSCSPRLALAVVLALFASYFVAVTVVPLFCANFLKAAHEHGSGSRKRPNNPGAPGSTRHSTPNSKRC